MASKKSWVSAAVVIGVPMNGRKRLWTVFFHLQIYILSSTLLKCRTEGRKDFTVSGNPYIILVNSSNSNEELAFIGAN